MNIRIRLVLGAAAALMCAAPAYAHFILLAPEPWIETSRFGDPQKAAPCGTSEITKGTPTGVVTEMRGGDMVQIRIKETIYHPGYYRVALSVLDRSELPPDPEATTRDSQYGPISVSGKIDPAPKAPVLADGLFEHRERPKPDAFWEAEIKLPNINCEKCTLQVLQFMEEHGLNKEGDFSYHHCADLKITANPALPIDKAWPGQGG